jgi:hypothetical protein
MKFNSINGASSVSVLHAKYGTDASVHGNFGIPLTAEQLTKTEVRLLHRSTLQTATFPLMINGNVRFEIRKYQVAPTVHMI